MEEYFKWLDTYFGKVELCEEWESGSEKGHGRIERRKITIVSADWYAEKAEWEDLKVFVRCHCTRTFEVKNDKTGKKEWKTVEFDRFYISNLEVSAERFGYIIRQHWSIENQLHWSLDVSFGEDDSKVRKDNAPENLDVLRKIALRLLRSTQIEKKLSIRRKQFKSAIDQNFLSDVLFGKS